MFHLYEKDSARIGEWALGMHTLRFGVTFLIFEVACSLNSYRPSVFSHSERV